MAAGGTVSSLLPNARFDAVEERPHQIWNDRGIPGRGQRIYRFIVEGRGSVELAYTNEKCGTIRRDVTLVATSIEPSPED